MPVADDLLLDDLPALERADAGGMLRATADAGAQVRRALLHADRDALGRAAVDGRPRGLLVAGMGGSGISGDVLRAVAGQGCPIPLETVRGYTLPGWAGPLDLVVAVSCSGSTEETLAVAAEALHRGCRVVGIGGDGSPLAELVRTAGAPFLPVDAAGLMPRAALWALSTPLLQLAHALGVESVTDGDLAAAADVLDDVATSCGPAVPVPDNPAKTLGLAVAESIPMVWGASWLASIAAYRLACQLNENAKLPCVFGAIPEANHNQVVALDGPYGAIGSTDDLFLDPVEDGGRPARLRAVLLRDTQEHPKDALRAEVSADLAAARDVPVDVLQAVDGHPVTRFASLVGVCDWTSVYAALSLGIDPSPIAPIDELKSRIRG